MSDLNKWTNGIHTGDARDTLAEIPDSSVHMVMTSPPYFGLRDYGVDGQIGLEESLDEYIGELVGVFREVRRVLRPDGSAWLNLGDSYVTQPAGNAGEPSDSLNGDYQSYANKDTNDKTKRTSLARKNKMLVPHRVAIALQKDGWIVRNDVTWVKPNPMPSSVKDRLNTTTEQVFHLVPEPDYWYDLDAIREPHADASVERMKHGNNGSGDSSDLYGHNESDGVNAPSDSREHLYNPAGKNPGDVFKVTTKPFPEAHFAVYPPELVETPLKATCPPKVCAECGSPSDCNCDTDAAEPGIALDPFAGAGTTCLVAKEHGRRFIGIDLNEKYVAMAQKRLGLTVDKPEHVRDDADAGLEDFA